MVAVFNKEVLSWYLITLKLRETVGAGVEKSAGSTPSPSGDLQLETPQQQLPQSEQHHRGPPQHQPSLSDWHSKTINGGGKNVVEEEEEEEEEGNPLESEWVISIREKLEQAGQEHDAASWAKLCIYKVPKSLQEGDDSHKAFVPQIVSLGPYHHDREHLREMERHKWRSFQRILERTRQEVKLYLDSIGELEEKARACYEGPITFSSYKFVEMMVLDGCFMLELFRGAAEGFKHLGYSRNDPVFAMRGVMHSIQCDMIMLENQIPLFVLDRLLGLQIDAPDQRGLVTKLALRFFDPLMPTDEPLQKSKRNKLESSLVDQETSTTITPFDPFTDQMGLHCLDIFRRSLLRRGPRPEPPPNSRNWIKWISNRGRVADKRRQQLIHSVTELQEAGVEFKKRKTDRFWDIKFENGVLWIPRLLIHDGTKSLFRNLIAFEQCHMNCGNDITSYVIFMDNLINSPADVAYLHYCDIIEHWLGSDTEVANLFNRLCQEVVFDFNESELSKMSEQVNRYYNQRWNVWKANLKHNYFSNPWASISVIAAVFLLFLTSVQTFYGVYAYYWPNN
ncbi:hypothetical protein NE237_018796 [Protea cynaroides]|uniref:Uncharacterized protein n=1 Tax=Protea cynaroides TaxID=273540 RepID=A0A9Q0KAK8_9MAGN|nr:hypothetical protein NE237_018796 [Protea cynaroides]